MLAVDAKGRSLCKENAKGVGVLTARRHTDGELEPHVIGPLLAEPGRSRQHSRLPR